MNSNARAVRPNIRDAAQRPDVGKPRFHAWSDEQDLVTGVLIESRLVAPKGRARVPLLALTLRQADGSLVSTLAYRYVQHLLGQAHDGHGVRAGDIIAIQRGDLVTRGKGLLPYREWHVEIIEGGPFVARAAVRARAHDDHLPIFGGFAPAPIDAVDVGTEPGMASGPSIVREVHP